MMKYFMMNYFIRKVPQVYQQQESLLEKTNSYHQDREMFARDDKRSNKDRGNTKVGRKRMNLLQI